MAAKSDSRPLRTPAHFFDNSAETIKNDLIEKLFSMRAKFTAPTPTLTGTAAP